MDEWKREELLNEELKQQLEKKVKRRGRMIVLTCVLCALIVLSLLFAASLIWTLYALIQEGRKTVKKAQR